jgi:hypothetical protein
MLSHDQELALLGKQVEAVLDFGDVWVAGTEFGDAVLLRKDPEVVARGQLMCFDDGGGIVLLDDNGFLAFCWPRLRMRSRG